MDGLPTLLQSELSSSNSLLTLGFQFELSAVKPGFPASSSSNGENQLHPLFPRAEHVHNSWKRYQQKILGMGPWNPWFLDSSHGGSPNHGPQHEPFKGQVCRLNVDPLHGGIG